MTGTYEASYGNETARLVLRPDHSLVHTVSAGGRPEELGSWRAYQTKDGTVIEFKNFHYLPSFERYEPRRSDGWSTTVARTWWPGLGRIAMCVDSDVGYCYVKKADP